MDKAAKTFLNTIKCPICKSPVDLVDWKVRSDIRKYNFCCSSNWEHYRLFFVHWEAIYYVEYENVVVYEGKHKYDISQFYNGLGTSMTSMIQVPNQRTEIYLLDVDPENRVIDNTEKKAPKFSYNQKLFDFSQTNREKIINRVKTILVFQ